MSPMGLSNPILDEIDAAHRQLTPPAQQAIALGMRGLGAPQPPGAIQPPEPAPPAASPVPAPRPIAAPATAVRGLGPTPAQGEYDRLTAPPLTGPLAHTKADTGQSGIDQIHNPWARHGLGILDALGTAIAPGLMMNLPGTHLHHQSLVSDAAGAVNQGNAQTESTAKVGETQARAKHENAQADALANPAEKPDKAEAKTVTTDQGVMQWNPETSRYDIKVGDAKAGKETGTVHQLGDGSLVIAHPDGSATAVTLNGQPVKGKTTEPKEPGLEDRIINEHIDKTHPGESLADARKHTQTTPPPDRGQNFVDPATGKMVRVEPGGDVPKGAVTAGGFSGENAGAEKADATAKKAKEDAGHEFTLAQALAANPSPTNDLALVMRYIGATKPDSLGKLRLNNNEVNLVYGTRSALGNMEALVSKLQNGQSLTPKQRQDMVDTMKLLSTGGGEGAAAQPKAGDTKQYQGHTYKFDGKEYVKQ